MARKQVLVHLILVVKQNICRQQRLLAQLADFPAEWTRTQVIEKICESMLPANTLEIKLIGEFKYQHLGLTSEGIPILSGIKVGENKAKLITAYPDFLTYGKFLKGEF